MKARNMTKEQVINDVLLDAQPTKQFVTIDQVAALALYLCSDAAAQITGANLSIDGGWTAAYVVVCPTRKKTILAVQGPAAQAVFTWAVLETFIAAHCSVGDGVSSTSAARINLVSA